MNVNIYDPYVRYEFELYHHGILGQRWGKKNGPPYPLGASDHSASEKKAGWRKSLNGGSSRSERKEVKALKKRLKRNEKTYIKNQAAYEKQGGNGMRAIGRGDVNALQKAANKQYIAKSNIEKAESDTWKAIAELVDKGYDVSTTQYKAYANKGEVIAGTLLASAGVAGLPIGSVLLNTPIIAASTATGTLGFKILENAQTVDANKYSVKKNPDGGKGRLRLNTSNEQIDSELTTVKINDAKTSKTDNVSDTSSEYSKQVNVAKKIIDDNDIIGGEKVNKLWNSSNPSDKKRIRDAADLGLKALEKTGRDAADDINNITDFDREWFMFEDQTLGLFTVADMVNRGKSKDQVKKAMDAAYSITYDYYDDPQLSKGHHNDAIFELQEAYDAVNHPSSYAMQKNFLDACYEVKADRNKSSNKQFPTTKTATNKFLNLSYEKRQQAMDNVRRMSNQDFTKARQMLNSGRSYEEIAKRLGVSESTVWAIFTDSGS